MNHSLKTGTVTGTLLSILGAISWVDVERTLILGAIGATISFLVSLVLKKTINYVKNIMGHSNERRPKR